MKSATVYPSSLLVLALSVSATAMPNPASVKCVESGGVDETRYDKDGSQYGVCNFGDGFACNEWALFHEECENGSDFEFTVFCLTNGGKIDKPDVDWGSVTGAPPAQYRVCTLDDGSECDESSYYGDDDDGCYAPSVLEAQIYCVNQNGDDCKDTTVSPPDDCSGDSFTYTYTLENTGAACTEITEWTSHMTVNADEYGVVGPITDLLTLTEEKYLCPNQAPLSVAETVDVDLCEGIKTYVAKMEVTTTSRIGEFDSYFKEYVYEVVPPSRRRLRHV